MVCYAGARIGKRVVLKAGAVIGGDGFGYLSGASGHARIPHVGACILEDDVEIGSNSTVDRGSVDDTVIGRGHSDRFMHGPVVRVSYQLRERMAVEAEFGLEHIRTKNEIGSTRSLIETFFLGYRWDF